MAPRHKPASAPPAWLEEASYLTSLCMSVMAGDANEAKEDAVR